MELWNKDIESRFFTESVKFATPEQLFYVTDDHRYLAYWPKGYDGKKSTLQSRNALIGKFSEKWTTDLIQEVIKDKGLFAVQGAICDEIALINMSPADVVISKSKNINQQPEEIVAIIEVKMSIVWNWELQGKTLSCIGDYKAHQGTPGLLRSDSMLKGIGKGINIRVSCLKAAGIPIIIMGNTPIKSSYYTKVDHLKEAGIIQGFWSVNPKPLDDNEENIKKTGKNGFYRFDSFEELKNAFEVLLSEERDFFSSMKSKKELGKIIEIANRETTYEKKAEIFLKLIKE
jgi:predicted house-cleaning noncanonical NTP pyrophosphatase (MazG superfamily)